MVFRGKPSKACSRCRARRLRCDLHSVACGQCTRADVVCSGYRDTKQLRIQNESQSVMRRASKQAPLFGPQSLPLSVDLQARDAFFIYYATGTSKCWNFLKRYYHPTDSPDHLTLAIEAASLGYLWHHVNSDAVLATARERYISALKMTKKAVKCPEKAVKDTTLLASLLLDLFEKITESKPGNTMSWISHVNGALALVELRGLQDFQDPVELHVLIRLINHYLSSSVASATLVPNKLIAIRDYIADDLNIRDHTLQLSDLTVQYAKLRSESRRGILSSDEYIGEAMGLDLKLQALDLNMPPSWEYSTINLDSKSDTAFDFHFDSYPHRNICFARNFIRVGRILLNESLIENYLASPSEKNGPLIAVAHDNINILARAICACVPQYADCDGPARERLPPLEKPELPGERHRSHSHTLHHQAECYSLIFPLYTAARSKAGPDVRPWVINLLHYIGGHFYIRNAEVVAQILERETDVCPWDIYAMLGSYAFNA